MARTLPIPDHGPSRRHGVSPLHPRESQGMQCSMPTVHYMYPCKLASLLTHPSGSSTTARRKRPFRSSQSTTPTATPRTSSSNEICYAIQLEEENSKTSFRDFVKTPGNRRRLLVLLTMATGTVSSPKTPRLTCCFGVPMAHILSAELGWEWYHHVLPRPGTQDCRNHGQHSNMFAETLPLDKR